MTASASFDGVQWQLEAVTESARQLWVDGWPVADTVLEARSYSVEPGFFDRNRLLKVEWSNVGHATAQILEAEGSGPGALRIGFDLNKTLGHDAGLGSPPGRPGHQPSGRGRHRLQPGAGREDQPGAVLRRRPGGHPRPAGQFPRGPSRAGGARHLSRPVRSTDAQQEGAPPDHARRRGAGPGPVRHRLPRHPLRRHRPAGRRVGHGPRRGRLRRRGPGRDRRPGRRPPGRRPPPGRVGGGRPGQGGRRPHVGAGDQGASTTSRRRRSWPPS